MNKNNYNSNWKKNIGIQKHAGKFQKVVPRKFSKYPMDKYVGMSINKHNTTLKIGFRSLNFFFWNEP